MLPTPQAAALGLDERIGDTAAPREPTRRPWSGGGGGSSEIAQLWRAREAAQRQVDHAPSELTEEAFAALAETVLALDRRIAAAAPTCREDLAAKVMVAVAALETDGDFTGACARLNAVRALLIDAERLLRPLGADPYGRRAAASDRAV